MIGPIKFQYSLTYDLRHKLNCIKMVLGYCQKKSAYFQNFNSFQQATKGIFKIYEFLNHYDYSVMVFTIIDHEQLQLFGLNNQLQAPYNSYRQVIPTKNYQIKSLNIQIVHCL